MFNEIYMQIALSLAKKAAAHGEVPVGCVIVGGDGLVIGRGYNRREETKSALSHAEIDAIQAACLQLGDWRLTGCTMYVTLEPCPMCAGAIIAARLSTLVFGAKDEVGGACGSVINLFEENFGHKPKIYSGVLAQESSNLLRAFFSDLRG
jgi:tRNA(adenine34) deaminase